jgi:hypothetical protein
MTEPSNEQLREAQMMTWAESDAPTVRPGTPVLRGEAARKAARALLEEATNDDPPNRELVRRVARRGRPPLNPDLAPGQRQPTWNIRMPADLDAAMRARAKAEGRRLSDVVRQAAAEYLSAHEAS